MKFWLVVCTFAAGGVWYSFSTDHHQMDASIIKEINPSCDIIRAWERSRLKGDRPIGLPAPDEGRLIECFPSYEGKDHLIEDHFRYAKYLENRLMRQSKSQGGDQI